MNLMLQINTSALCFTKEKACPLETVIKTEFETMKSFLIDIFKKLKNF